MSSIAVCSATRTGCDRGSTFAAVPMRMRLVRAATCVASSKRVGRDAVAVEMVLRHPDRVEAQLLGVDHQVGFVAVHVGIGPAGRRLDKSEDNKAHSEPSRKASEP